MSSETGVLPNHSVFLILGTNLGDRPGNMETALKYIAEQTGKVIARSALYESEAWGMESDRSFLNMAIEVRTSLSPDELLKVLLQIEAGMGRIRTGEVEDRIIDIDIAFYDSLILKTVSLTIPHPRIHLRKFALIPLLEIAPELVHPELGRSIRDLIRTVDDQSEVTILESQ